MHLVVAADERSRHILVSDLVAGMENGSGVGAEDRIQSLLVIRFDGVVKGQNCVARRSEGLFVALLREDRDKKQGGAQRAHCGGERVRASHWHGLTALLENLSSSRCRSLIGRRGEPA